MRVASLHVHPLKGGAIHDVPECAIAPIGMDGDRRWMIVNEKDRFLTQRELPALARIDAEATERGLSLHFDGEGRDVALNGGRVDVTIWRDVVNAATVRLEDDEALSHWLGRPVRLVFFDFASTRPTNAVWSDGEVAFADGYPVLVVTASSVDALNDELLRRGADPVPIQRFRPNVVIDGADAWADDGWATIRIGDVVLDLVKPCDRCAVTTVDQDRGVRTGDEPLRTLRDLRFSADRRVPGVLFGWNAVPRNAGRIRAGDPVEVMERRSPWPIRARSDASTDLPF